MKKISVNVKDNYDILIGEGLLDMAGSLIKDFYKKKKRVVIITDDIVEELYFDKLNESLLKVGFKSEKISFGNGEKSKNFSTYIFITEELARLNIKRDDLIIALGGGVVGDMAGFVAATYLRGIEYIQIPTTLLSAVDSSVGGKTAIDIVGGKNLIGAFYQPKMVIIDPLTFKTLSEDIYRDGIGEIIKYAYIEKSILEEYIKYTIDKNKLSDKTISFEKSNKLDTFLDLYKNKNKDFLIIHGDIKKIEDAVEILGVYLKESLYNKISTSNVLDFYNEIVYRCVLLKAMVVEMDEKEKGIRKLLNLGHSIGHSIEYGGKFNITHGYCVALGLYYITKYFVREGENIEGLLNGITWLLEKYNIKIGLNGVDKELMINSLSNDKKTKGSEISLIMPYKIGEVKIVSKSIKSVEKYISTLIK